MSLTEPSVVSTNARVVPANRKKEEAQKGGGMSVRESSQARSVSHVGSRSGEGENPTRQAARQSW